MGVAGQLVQRLERQHPRVAGGGGGGIEQVGVFGAAFLVLVHVREGNLRGADCLDGGGGAEGDVISESNFYCSMPWFMAARTISISFLSADVSSALVISIKMVSTKKAKIKNKHRKIGTSV